LTITKNISLIGAGVGTTNITNGTGGLLIRYSPTSNADLFRISGFTFDCNNGKCIQLFNNTLNPPIYQLRIDHNRFTNSTSVAGGVEAVGVRGVVDNNTFDAMRSPVRNWGDNSGPGIWDWANFAELVWGTNNDNLYYEDNEFVLNASAYMISDMDQGGRYVFRYNNFTHTGGGDVYPWLDVHGGAGVLRGSFGAEIYGNRYSDGGFLVSHRGGRVAAFFNSMEHFAEINIYNDRCPTTDVEKINNSYYFLNRTGLTGVFPSLTSTLGDVCGGTVVENSTFWIDNPANDGTVGVGAGSLASRPATCTVGVGYWATDQSITDLTGMVGPDPATPIAGTLYKCTTTNTWTAYYTPLTYPHPLTTGAVDTLAPAAPGSMLAN
jgi:hypothetical protein